MSVQITEFQMVRLFSSQFISGTNISKSVYALLQQIPKGRVCSYKDISNALNSSPRAVGGALRNNPYSPVVPCHRVIATTGFIGGYMGDWRDVPSGLNLSKKVALLSEEGVSFDENWKLLDKSLWWKDFNMDNLHALNIS